MDLFNKRIKNIPNEECDSIRLYPRLLGIYFVCLILGAMNIGIIGSLLKILAILPISAWLLNKPSVHNSQVLQAAFFYVVSCAVSCLWSINFSESVSRAITQILFFILLLSTTSIVLKQNEIEYLKSCLIWSSRISAVITLISSDYVAGRLYLNGLVREDPNYLCAYLMFGISDCLLNILNSEKKSKKIYSSIELLLYIYVIFATGSRGGLLANIIVFGTIFLFAGWNSNRHYIIKRLSIIVLMIFSYFVVTNYVDRNIISRYSINEISQSGGTGRYDLWLDALYGFHNSSIARQLIGYGTGTIRDFTNLFPFHEHNVLHNIFLEVLIEIGIVGLILYFYHVVSFVILSVKYKDVFVMSIILGMIVLSLSTSLYAFKPYWNIMFYAMCVLKINSGIDNVKRST